MALQHFSKPIKDQKALLAHSLYTKNTHTLFLRTHIYSTKKSSIILQPNLTAALFCSQNEMDLVYLLNLNSLRRLLIILIKF